MNRLETESNDRKKENSTRKYYKKVLQQNITKKYDHHEKVLK